MSDTDGQDRLEATLLNAVHSAKTIGGDNASVQLEETLEALYGPRSVPSPRPVVSAETSALIVRELAGVCHEEYLLSCIVHGVNLTLPPAAWQALLRRTGDIGRSALAHVCPDPEVLRELAPSYAEAAHNYAYLVAHGAEYGTDSLAKYLDSLRGVPYVLRETVRGLRNARRPISSPEKRALVESYVDILRELGVPLPTHETGRG